MKINFSNFSVFSLLLFSLTIDLSLSDETSPSLSISPSSISSQVVSISFSLDNGYLYPTIVCLTSILQNKKPSSIYNFYILITDDFSTENQNIIRRISNSSPNCTIYFFKMGNSFQGAKTDFRIPLPSYYRLYLPKFLPKVDRIIYLDGDTLIFEDLTEMINLDMKDKYVLGFPDGYIDAFLMFGLYKFNYVCAGVLLIDLDKLRKFNYVQKFEQFIKDFKYKLIQHDQTTINIVLGDRIGKLPPKYGMWAFNNKEAALEHNRELHQTFRYDEQEIVEGYMHPAILHFAGVKKPWQKVFTGSHKTTWWRYAEMTDFYEKIKNKYDNN